MGRTLVQPVSSLVVTRGGPLVTVETTYQGGHHGERR